jgi:hypothetical protein
MEYRASVRVDKEDKVIVSVAEFPNEYESASNAASAKLTVPEALALAAKLVHAAADLLEKELEAAR